MDKIEQMFLNAIEPAIRMLPVNAMLGDGTITQTNTFDPSEVRKFFQSLGRNLGEKGWSYSEVSNS